MTHPTNPSKSPTSITTEPRAVRGVVGSLLAAACVMVGVGCAEGGSGDREAAFEKKARWAAEAFDAPVMTPEQLAIALQSAEAGAGDASAYTEGRADPARAPLLVDTRTIEEYHVSHLPNAVNWPDYEDGPPPTRVVEHARSGGTVVFYCSIGYRAGMAAQRAAEAFGSERGLFNLRGGIFQWANQGRALQGGPLVHGYNSEWADLLKPELRAPLP